MNTDNGNLYTLLCAITDPDQMAQVLDALLTPKELEELDNRLRIFAGLAAGRPQRSIAQDLGVGIATVTRGAQAYKACNWPALMAAVAAATSTK